jgi:hypothetical protein
MPAINPADLSKFVGILEVAPVNDPLNWRRVASVRGLVANFDVTQNLVEVKADDTGTVFKGFIPEARIEGDFLENMNMDVMETILGGTRTNVAGTPVAGASQTLTSGAWDVNQHNAFENQNGDGSAVTVNSVTGGTDGLLTVNDDYDVVQLPSGAYGVVLQDLASATNLTTISQDIVINYDYTPNASEQIEFDVSFSESPNLLVRITVTEGGKTRRILMDSATFEGVYGLSFLDVVENGDIQGTSFVFKANKGSLFTIYDEILSE